MEKNLQIKSAPLSQTQLGIYFECLRMNDTLAYNIHTLFTPDNSTDMEKLARAIEKAVAAHPYMFVKIIETDGEPQQILEDVQDYHQEVLKMSEAEWQETLPKLLKEPLELIGGRLFRFNLVETEKAKYFLRTTHHIAFDGTAYKILFNDIAAAYSGEEIIPESYDSIDFANAETAARAQKIFDDAKNYYEKIFSGLDVESMVKVGMMAKQSEYDKMQQKYTKNEWTKAQFLDLYGEVQTFNNSTLSQYKMSNTMNARGASSADSKSVGATANANAAIMTHYVQVDKLASNVYLIGTEMERENSDAKVKNQLQSLLFKSIAKSETDGKIKVTYADNTTQEYFASDTAIFFSINDGVNQLLPSTNAEAVTATATPYAEAGEHTVEITATAQAATATATTDGKFVATSTTANILASWTSLDFDATEVTEYFSEISTRAATRSVKASSDTTAIAFTVGDGENSAEVSFNYAELYAEVVNATATAQDFVDAINAKIGSSVKVKASIVDDNLTFINTTKATGADSKVILSFNQTMFNNATEATVAHGSYSTDVSAAYQTALADAISTETSKSPFTSTDNSAITAAYNAAYVLYTNSIKSLTSAPADTTVTTAAYNAAYAAYKSAATETVSSDEYLKAAVAEAYDSRNYDKAVLAGYNKYRDTTTASTNTDKSARNEAFSNYATSTNTTTALTKAYAQYKSAAHATSTSTPQGAAYASYETDQNAANALDAAYNSSSSTAVSNAVSSDTAAVTAAYSTYKSVQNSSTALADAYSAYKTAAGATYETTAIGAAYANGSDQSAALNAAYEILKTNAGATDTTTAIGAAYANGSDSATALSAAYAVYQSAVDTENNAAKSAAYTTYSGDNLTAAINAAFNKLQESVTGATETAYSTYLNTINTAGKNATDAYNAASDTVFTSAYNSASSTAVTNADSTDTAAVTAAYNNGSNSSTALTQAYAVYQNAVSGAAAEAYSTYLTQKNSGATDALAAAKQAALEVSGTSDSDASTYASNAAAAYTKASTYATSAANDYASATSTATTAAGEAQTAYNNATSYATAAADAYSKASDYATSAQNDYNTAKNTATTAAGEAQTAYSTATTYANAAKTDYDTASGFATNAKNAYDEAEGYATAAAAAYGKATTYAGNAKSAYDNATTYAGNAAAAYSSSKTYAEAAKTAYDNTYNNSEFTAAVTAAVADAVAANTRSNNIAADALAAAKSDYEKVRTDGDNEAALNASSTKFDSIAVTLLEQIKESLTDDNRIINTDTSVEGSATRALLRSTGDTTYITTVEGENVQGTVNGTDISTLVNRSEFSSDGNTFTVGGITYTAQSATTQAVKITDLGDQNIAITYRDLLNGFTFNDLASKINSKGINVKATYDSVQDRFSIYNKESGKENQINIGISANNENGTDAQKVMGTNTANLFNAFGLKKSTNGSLNEDAENFSENSETKLAGTNGSVAIDGVKYEIASNKTTVNGVTYNFLNTTDSNVAVSVTQDTDAIVSKVKSFVEDYNALMKKLYEWYDEKPNSDYKPLTESQKSSMKDEQIEKWEEKAKAGLLYHDKTLGNLITEMRSVISENVAGITGKYTNIFSIGISTTGLKGQLTIDSDKLNAALAEDPDAVYNIFAKLDKGETQYWVENTKTGQKFWTTNPYQDNLKIQTKRNDATGEAEEITKTVERSSYNGIAQRLGDVFVAGMKNIKAVSGSSAEVTEDSELNNLLRELQTKMSNFQRMMKAFETKLYKKYDAMESSLALLGAQLNYVTGAFQ